MNAQSIFLQLISVQHVISSFFHINNIIHTNMKSIIQILQLITHPKFPIKMISFKEFYNIFMFTFCEDVNLNHECFKVFLCFQHHLLECSTLLRLFVYSLGNLGEKVCSTFMKKKIIVCNIIWEK